MKRKVAFCLWGLALCTPVFADNPANAPAIPTLTSPTQFPEQLAPEQSNENNRGNPLDQGGETCATATPITALPYCDTGTTAGHINDYVPPCNTPHTAPDVVYSMTPPVNAVISVSLCGSSYNTVLHIWRGCPGAGGVLICCNDDFCSVQSCCQNITVAANTTYYIIVDGNGGAAGNYSLSVALGQQCPQPCPPDTCPYPDQDIDPINNSCTANNVQIGCDTSCGLINPTDDLDFYNFTVPAGGPCLRLTIDVFADDTPGWFPFGQGLDPIVTLIAADCATSLAEDDNGGTGNDARLISPCLPPGQYRILVRTSPLFASVGPYILAVACDPCPCEPDTCPYRDEDIGFNNVCADANPTIGCPDTVCGEINPVDDGDYYEFRIPTGSCARVRIDVFGNDTPGWWPFGQGLNPHVCLYDEGCTVNFGCDFDGGVGNDAHLVSPCLPAGLYELRVGDDINGTTGPYILAINCLPCQCPPDTCPYPDLDCDPPTPVCDNDLCGDWWGDGINPEIDCDDTTCGDIDPAGDVDWYCLYVASDCRRVIIDVFGNDTPGWFPFGQGLDPKVSLYDVQDDCLFAVLLATDDDGGVGADSRLVSPCLGGGRLYRVKVEAGGAGGSMGPYILAVACEPCEPCPPDSCEFPHRDPEPLNNTCNDQIPLLHCEDKVCGEIQPADDRDYYSIQITDCQILTIGVFADDTPGWYPFGLGLDTRVFLFDENCAGVIAADDDGGVGTDSWLVSPCLTPGVYRIRVDGGAVTSGPYVLAVHCEPCECPPCPYPDLDQPFEPGNNLCDSQHCPVIIQCEDALCGRINPQDDVDWYCLQMNVTPCGIMTIDVFGDNTPGWFPFGLGLDPKVSIYTPDCGTLIATDDNSGVGNDARVVSPCLPPGFYAIKVEGIPPTMGPYILAVHCTPCQCPDTCTVVCPGGGVPEGEPCPNVPDFFNAGCNTDPPTFRPVNCGQTICGTSWADGGARDEDWFGLQIDEPDTFFWCVEAEFPFEIAIFAPGPGLDPCDDLDTLDYATGDSCVPAVCIGACMQPGFYILYVAPTVFDGVDCRDYVARLVCTICAPRVCEPVENLVIDYPTAARQQELRLYWRDILAVRQYNIFRATNVGDLVPLPCPPYCEPPPEFYLASTSDTFYLDTTAFDPPATKYFYVVTARCDYGDFAPAAPGAPAAIHKERERMSEER